MQDMGSGCITSERFWAIALADPSGNSLVTVHLIIATNKDITAVALSFLGALTGTNKDITAIAFSFLGALTQLSASNLHHFHKGDDLICYDVVQMCMLTRHLEEAQAVLFGRWKVGGVVVRDSISYRLTNPSRSLRLGLVSLYNMLPLTTTPPTFHLPNNSACGRR